MISQTYKLTGLQPRLFRHQVYMDQVAQKYKFWSLAAAFFMYNFASFLFTGCVSLLSGCVYFFTGCVYSIRRKFSSEKPIFKSLYSERTVHWISTCHTILESLYQGENEMSKFLNLLIMHIGRVKTKLSSVLSLSSTALACFLLTACVYLLTDCVYLFGISY